MEDSTCKRNCKFSSNRIFGLLTVMLFIAVIYSCQKNKQAGASNVANNSVAQEQSTESMQTIKDDTGTEVTVPRNPKRIICGNQALVFLPVYELGFNIVGAGSTNLDPETGAPIIFGLKQVYGTTSAELGIKNVGVMSNLDFEAVRSVQPDVLIGIERDIQIREQLAGIVPVYINKTYTGSVIGNEAQKKIAKVFGAMDKYNELDARYQKRLSQIRAKIPYDPATKTYVQVMVADKLTVTRSLGGFTKVMEDLGYQVPKWIVDKPRLPVSAEDLKKLDQDLVILQAGYSYPTRDKTRVEELMNTISPGWDKFLNARKEGRVIYPDMVLTLSPTFASAMNALDYLEEYFAGKFGNS